MFCKQPKLSEEILATTNVYEIKRLSQRVPNGQLLKLWYEEGFASESLYRANVLKVGSACAGDRQRKRPIQYQQNKRLREALLRTRGSRLAEASACDRRWGIGRSLIDEKALDPAQWLGENNFGDMLTRIRDVLWPENE